MTTIVVGLEEFADRPQVQLYPNPVSDHLTLLCDRNIQEVIVSNMEGKQYIRQTVNNRMIKLNTALFPAGVYTVEIITKNHSLYRKMVK